MRTRLTVVSVGLAMAAAIYLMVWPVYSGSDGGRPAHATLKQVKQAVRIAAAIVLGGFVLISGFSIGLFYFPSAILMLLAPCVEPSAKFRDVFS